MSGTLNANVAAVAAHGETVGEMLGSGDGGQANQRFTLKKPPLTYVAAPTPSGTQSSLQVQVDGVRWQEVPALFGVDERSRSYIVRIDDDAKATVIFGDGRQGARLPTGTENVTATYRSGIGLQGLVAEHSLTLLQTRPPGVRGVTNPVAASGAADPENLDSARDNAPLGVLTLDRIVSLRDFEDFARGFAGVGKAQAVAFWLGETHLVHVTVAAVDGAVVDPTSALHISLVQAIGAVADPVRQFQVDPHQPLFFNLAAKILVHPDYQPDAVFDAVRAALLSAFSFERRAFGQPVTAAEVVTAVQQVAGVVAVDLDQLYRVDDPGGHEQQAPEAVVGRRGRPWRGAHQARPASACQPGRNHPAADGGGAVNAADVRGLYELLPAAYRTRDAALGDPLRALLGVIETEFRTLQDDIDRLYDNWFVETCDEWVVPYIGDLLGVRPLLPIGDGVFTQRASVANTIGYRRRKGTAAMLEQLARDVTGWPGRRWSSSSSWRPPSSSTTSGRRATAPSTSTGRARSNSSTAPSTRRPTPPRYATSTTAVAGTASPTSACSYGGCRATR
jgi:hypothetical protein